MSPDSSETAAAEVSPPPSDSNTVVNQAAAEEAHGSGETSGSDGPPASSEIPAAGPAVYRTAGGWRVGEEELPDLVSAMVLADLLAEELPAPLPPAAGGTAAGHAPEGDSETAKLKLTVTQLEHALANRVRVEQAIGTLAERHRLPPRSAFELLRGAARSRGRRVHDLAGEVVQSITNPLLPLPEELARPPRAQRSRARPRPV
jgi:ANTAR domain